jgi:hypothetical protein
MRQAEEAYQAAIYMTTSDEPQNMVLMAARVLMAERERCASIAEAAARTKVPRQADMLTGMMAKAMERGGTEISGVIAAAIRNGE